MGEETLARWLLAPAKIEEIRMRQEAVIELRDELDLREDLAVLGEDAGVGVHSEQLVTWSESPNQMTRRWLAWLAPVLAVLAVGAAVVWAVWGIATPFVLVVAVEAGLTYSQRNPIGPPRCMEPSKRSTVLTSFRGCWSDWSRTAFAAPACRLYKRSCYQAERQRFRPSRSSGIWLTSSTRGTTSLCGSSTRL